MPGLLQSQRKRPVIDLSEDECEPPGYSSSVSVGSKRARHDRDASRSLHTGNGNRSRVLAENGYENGSVIEDTFQPGSLVRVKLKNFVTYTAAEFHLGPSLNMIIGPNGTGKSTLVCAICLGLGWSSEHLGRAKELGAFVKHGNAEAEIEIELAAAPEMPKNPVVRRLIRKEDNKSIFWINGGRASQKDVMNLARGFSIQIDNLCQFLPQDRVVEFARMQDVDRLRETQRAAAPPHMLEWHDKLKTLRLEEKGLEVKQQNDQDHLKKLENQQHATREDVERWHQREDLLQKSKCLRKVKPIIEIRLCRDEVTQAKKELLSARQELDQIKIDVAPVQQAQVDAEMYRDQIDQVTKLRMNRLDMMKTQVEKATVRIEKEKANIGTFAAQKDSEANSQKGRQRDIERCKSDIMRFQRQLQEEPVRYDEEDYRQRKNEIVSQISAADLQVVDKQSTINDIRLRAQEAQRNKAKVIDDRNMLQTQTGKQKSVLSKLSADTAKAWEYIKQNKDKWNLKGNVFGPAVMECSIPNSAHAPAVEALLKIGDLVAITCTDQRDSQFISRHVLNNNESGLGVHDVYFRTSSKPLSEYRRPVPPEQLGRLGLEGYVLDFMEGPDVVLAMLCDNQRLQKVGYTSESLSEEQHENIARSPIQTYINGKDLWRITTRREYGASSISTTKLRTAQHFVDQPVNQDEIRRLDEALARHQREGVELQEELQRLRQEIAEIQQQKEVLKTRKDQIQTDQDRIRKVIALWEALPAKIESRQTQLADMLEQEAQMDDRIRGFKSQAREAALKLATLTVEYAKSTTQLRAFHESLVEAEIRLIEATSEQSALEKENRDILKKLKDKEIEIRQLEQRHKELRNDYTQRLKPTQDNIDALTPEERELVMEYRQLPSLEALEQEVQAVNARLEMMAEGNPGAIKAYERREEELAKTRQRLEEHAANLKSTKENITEIRDRWEPELDELVVKISDAFGYNFRQIGCAGEVTVYKDPDNFEGWSIQISVKFREGEPMSVLNSFRQSGGERAVSTIFYLMALQDLAQSPFRVVDEINQGMDPRNERMVHERMVDIACQEHTSQYFLVTPKLLTGLKFHPKMKVHIINSGEHVPHADAVKGNWDLRQFAKIALSMRKGR